MAGSEDIRGAERDAAGDTPSCSRGRSGPGWGYRIGRIGGIVAATYLTVCTVLTAFQSRLIYFPTRGYDATPADVGLSYEPLELLTDDGVSIAAWYVPHVEPIGSLIFCHGNAGNMADRLHAIEELHRLRLNVLIFDYRGYGDSEGSPSETGTYEDAMTVWRHLTRTRGEPPHRVVLFGRSLGGAVAIELALRVGQEPPIFERTDAAAVDPRSPGDDANVPAGVIVESTFTSLVDIGRLHYPLLPVSWMLTYRYESISKVPRIHCPKLFFHGDTDELIPIENGRKLFEAAPGPKTFLETPGGHNEAGFSYSPEYRESLRAWLEQVLPEER